MKRRIIIVALIILGVGLGIGAAAYLIDVHDDRESTIRVTGPVRVYDRESPPGYTRGDEGVIEFLNQGEPAQVLRIHEGDGVESIRVRLRDGREGYIFCCDNFELSR